MTWCFAFLTVYLPALISKGRRNFSDSRRVHVLNVDSSDKASDSWIAEFCRNRKGTFPAGIAEGLKKVKIAIIDTGLDGEHPSVLENWTNPNFHTRYKNFLSDDSSEISEIDPEDTCGHGTYVAGIILQLAPDAELCIARVFSSGSAEEFRDHSAKERVVKASLNFFSATGRHFMLNALPFVLGNQSCNRCVES